MNRQQKRRKDEEVSQKFKKLRENNINNIETSSLVNCTLKS